jgi:putative transposase
VPQGVRVENNILYVPKFLEGIKFIRHREMMGTVRQCTISRNPSWEYYVSILVEREITCLPKTGKQVGIDLGIKDLVILDNGEKIANPKFGEKFQAKLSKTQRRLAKKKLDSKNRKKARIKTARVYKKIANSRKDYIHKLTTRLVREFDVICSESLQVQSMMKSRRLARRVQDASFGEIIRQLEYKASWYGKELVKIDRWFPSSKRCNCCGSVNHNLTLDDRTWTCPNCGTTLDRDVNAAKNILEEGRKILLSRQELASTPMELLTSGKVIDTLDVKTSSVEGDVLS